jgi:hypothetical protein
MDSEEPLGAATAAEDTETAEGAPDADGTNGSAPVAGPTGDEAVGDEAAGEPGTPAEASTEEPPPGDRAPGPVTHPSAVVMVFDIAVDLPTPHARLTLREVDNPHRMLVIPIGLPEGTALAHAWRGVATPRPLTHELFSDVLTRLGATIEAVRLTGRRAGVVLAEIELSSPRGREVVPCRPTDGVTLSVRQGVSAPILVDLRLFADNRDVDPDG